MAKKTFVSRARVVQGTRWYIDYQTISPETGETTRHRRDFDLNEIQNIEIRQEVAARLCRYLDHFVVTDAPPIVRPMDTVTVEQAVIMARDVKMSGPRTNTHKGYKSISKAFLAWAVARSYAHLPAHDFTKKHCRAFFDYLQTQRKYRGVTLNNYLSHLGGMWSEMIGREMVKDNPWKSIKPFKKEERLRRAFTDQERRIVAAYIREHDYWLFRALLLQYYCYVRPVELIRIKGKAFDFAKGVVKIESYEAKKWKTRFATIPANVLHYFADGVFDKCPANWYPFGLVDGGKGMATIGPSTQQLNEHRLYARHKKHLQRLVKSGALHDMVGLTWYSWKYTGISMHAKKTTPLSTRDQAGHSDFDMTLVYYQADKVNNEYRALSDDIFT
jgi:integrase